MKPDKTYSVYITILSMVVEFSTSEYVSKLPISRIAMCYVWNVQDYKFHCCESLVHDFPKPKCLSFELWFRCRIEDWLSTISVAVYSCQWRYILPSLTNFLSYFRDDLLFLHFHHSFKTNILLSVQYHKTQVKLQKTSFELFFEKYNKNKDQEYKTIWWVFNLFFLPN